MTAWKELWAKTPVNPAGLAYEETLAGHIQRVCEAADILSASLEPKLLTVAGLEESDIIPWKQAVMVGAWMHDWGKANDHFQKMLREPTFLQGVRHETITLIIATELQDWLAPLWEEMPSWAKCAALFSASGHHLKFPDPFEDRRSGVSVKVLLSHKDLGQILELRAKELGLTETPALEDRELSLLRRGDLRKQIFSLQRELERDFTDKEKILVAAAKSTVMAADLAGSALPSRVSDPVTWPATRLEHSLNREQLGQVVNTKLHGNPPREFQKSVALAEQGTVLVEAGCGSGKTAAAYLWAAEKANGKRLFFCYPTTGTASEGFAGYLRDPDFDAILIHSRSEADYRLLDNMPRPSHEENDLRQDRLETADTWAIPAVVCTAHTVLGLMENVRRGIYAFLSLVGEEDRHAHIGTKVAIAATQLPEVSRVVRTIWSIRNKDFPPGIGNNKRPDYQEILTGLEIGIWVAPGPLAARLQTAGNSPKAISRYGGLSLGESRDLVDEIHFQPCWTGSGMWLIPATNGDQPLPVWVDHVGSKGTHWMQFRLAEAPLMDPSPNDERWINISPA